MFRTLLLVVSVLVCIALLWSRPESPVEASDATLMRENGAPGRAQSPSMGGTLTPNPFAPKEQGNTSNQRAPTAPSMTVGVAANVVAGPPRGAAPAAAPASQPAEPAAAADDFGDCLGCAKNDTNHPEIVRIFVTTTAGTLWYQGGGDFFILSHFLTRNLEMLGSPGSISEKPTYSLMVVMADGGRQHVDVGDSWIASEGLVGPVDSALLAKLETSTFARRGQELHPDKAKEMVR